MHEGSRSRLIDWLENLSQGVAVCLVAVLVLLVGLGNSLTIKEIPFTLAYLLPIALSAWRLGRFWSVLTVLACGLSWLLSAVGRRELALPPATSALSLLMELGVFLSFGLVLSALRERLEAEMRLARTDALTGLANRRAFFAELSREVERSRRFGAAFSIAYLDVDGFKEVNDRLGHRIGDELLQAIATQLEKTVRRVDVVARLGGDEFALLLPGTDEIGAMVVMRKLQKQLNPGLQSTFSVACSMGCLTVLDPPVDAEHVVAKADQLMYEAKRRGRGELCHGTMPPLPSRHEPRQLRSTSR